MVNAYDLALQERSHALNRLRVRVNVVVVANIFASLVADGAVIVGGFEPRECAVSARHQRRPRRNIRKDDWLCRQLAHFRNHASP